MYCSVDWSVVKDRVSIFIFITIELSVGSTLKPHGVALQCVYLLDMYICTCTVGCRSCSVD